MMAIPNFNNNLVKKKLDITHGDLVYLRGDETKRAGLGVVVSTERWSFDIYDTPRLRRGCFFIDKGAPSTLVNGVLVYWFGIEKEMWMENYDLSLV
jgi:hypothetical protein